MSFGAEGEMAVHGAQRVEQGRVVGKDGGRTIAYVLNRHIECALDVLRDSCGHETIADILNRGFSGVEMVRISRAEVEQGGGTLGDGVDGGASRDVADVEGGERFGGELHVGDGGEYAAENKDGVGCSGVDP